MKLKFFTVLTLLFLSYSSAFAQSEDPLAELNAATPQNEVFEAKILEVISESEETYDETQIVLLQELLIEATTGSQDGEQIQLEFNQLIQNNDRRYQVNDRVLVNYSKVDNIETYYVIEYIRRPAIMWLFAAFALLVLAIGRWNGLSALTGLVTSFVIIFMMLIPGIQAGYNPILITILSSILIITVSFYITHGISEKTTLAVIGTSASLIVTSIIANISINAANLSGFGSEEASFLQFLKGDTLDMRGLLLAGMMLATLGVLDDITISQSSIVRELKSLKPDIQPGRLFIRAMNVGRDHIASLVNTLVLVYTAGSLPLLLLFQLDENRSFLTVLNYSMVAEEIIAMLVGSIGIVLAVPVTTFIAAYFGYKDTSKLKIEDHDHSHGHHHH